MIYFTAHTFNCVCHCIRAMFRVLGMYNFDTQINVENILKTPRFTFRYQKGPNVTFKILKGSKCHLKVP